LRWCGPRRRHLSRGIRGKTHHPLLRAFTVDASTVPELRVLAPYKTDLSGCTSAKDAGGPTFPHNARTRLTETRYAYAIGTVTLTKYPNSAGLRRATRNARAPTVPHNASTSSGAVTLTKRSVAAKIAQVSCAKAQAMRTSPKS
jgi:hypothetical protein